MSETRLVLYQVLDVEPCGEEYPLHSYITSKTKDADGVIMSNAIKYGPVPDVLVPEFMHELKESWSSSMDSAFSYLREQVKNLGKHIGE